MVEKKINIALQGSHGRPILTDVHFDSSVSGQKPVLIFCHGYKGFKDWGYWSLMGDQFARKGIIFVNFGFAFNGCTSENLMEFGDLEAFGQNTFSKELDDLDIVIGWVIGNKFPFADQIDPERVALMGHSRGGAVAVLKTAEDPRIKKLITLAAVSDLGVRFPEGDQLEKWKNEGVAYVENSRTKQQMPHFFEFYEDYKNNRERLTVSRAAMEIKVPALIVHGTTDSTVPVSHAYDLAKWISNSEIFLLEGSDHVFEGSHPWTRSALPPAVDKIVERVTSFVHT